MKPTAEQELIMSRMAQMDRNLLVNARAGAAKTTTIKLVARNQPNTKIRAIAFNKKIADELKAELPDNCESATLNGVCHRAAGEYLGRLTVNKDKNFHLLKQIMEEENLSQKDTADLWDNMADLKRFAASTKVSGFVPGKVPSWARVPITDPDFFWAGLDINPTDLERHIIEKFAERNFKEALSRKIDFDDQILLAAVCPVPFDKYDLTIVDETQDLSHLNHLIVKKMLKSGLLMAVGDPLQAIYEFRGASTDSMAEMQKMFSMEELYLTMCFRSAKNIVKEAHWRAPDMRWRPDAPDGVVKTLNGWTGDDLQDGDAIICRNNAPLFSMAFTLLREGKHPELATGDLVAGLKTAMKKLGKESMDTTSAIALLPMLAEQRKKRLKDKNKADDQIECIRIFLEQADTLGSAIKLVDEVVNRAGKIKLMTGHKSKGLEFNRVFLMNTELLRPAGQDLNLKYVMQTRARNELFYVTSERFGVEHQEEESEGVLTP